MIKTNSNESKQISKNENNAHSVFCNLQCGLRVAEMQLHTKKTKNVWNPQLGDVDYGNENNMKT